MTHELGQAMGIGAACGIGCVPSLASAAQAQDFFSNLFGGFGRSRAPAIRMPFGSEGENFGQRGERPALWRRRSGLLRADLRRPPFPGHGQRTARAARRSCSSLCPASETKVVYGGSIDDAATENGKPYSALPNAFRYRNELVAGCTCNGKDPLGLASGQDRERPDLAQGRHRRRRQWLGGRRPQRRQARRRAEFLAGLGERTARYQRMPVVARE